MAPGFCTTRSKAGTAGHTQGYVAAACYNREPSSDSDGTPKGLQTV
jgi:hypothetical protein